MNGIQSPLGTYIVNWNTIMVSQAELERAIHEKVGNIDTVFVSDVSGGCGQAYDVVIVSDLFEGKTTLQRHRLVNDRLKEEIASMHAFSQKTYTTKQFEELRSKYARQGPSVQSSAATSTQASQAAFSSANQSVGSSPNLARSGAGEASMAKVPKIDTQMIESMNVPKLTLTPVTEKNFGSHSPHLEDRSGSGTPNLDGSNISRLHYATICEPSFWLHLRELLQTQVMQQSDSTATDADFGAPEVKQIFEDFFLSQKDQLSASDVARIRDTTGMHGMSR